MLAQTGGGDAVARLIAKIESAAGAAGTASTQVTNMSVHEVPFKPQPEPNVPLILHQLVMAGRHAAVAALTAAVITRATGRLSVQEILGIQDDFYFSMYPDEGSTAYLRWAELKKEHLEAIH